MLETITALFAAVGFDSSQDGWVNAPGGTMVLANDRHVWDDSADPGPYTAQGSAPASPSAAKWSVLVGGVERPAKTVAVLVGGVERPLTSWQRVP